MIALKHLQKTIGRLTVLDIDTLEVGVGEIVGVGGVIGDEQRLLLGLLTGKIRPTAGNIEVAGLNPAAHPAATGARTGVLFGENALYERHTARANLEFYCRLLGLPLVRAGEVLALVGLADHAGVAAGKLPAGLARRLALGRAILSQPAALLLAEPFAGCDPASIEVISRLIRQLADEQAAVLILAAEAAKLSPLCQKVILLEQGRVVQRYNPAESSRATDLPFKIPARLEGKVVLVNPAEIGYVSAEEGRTALHLADGQEINTHFTLNELEERLGRSGFFRAHRGYLVNLQRVKEVVTYTRDSFTLVLESSTNAGRGPEIPLSKTAARELRQLLGY